VTSPRRRSIRRETHVRIDDEVSEVTDCLDIACGDIPQGTVNLDLYRGDTKHRHDDNIHIKLTPNFIVGDACHLPFRTGTFDLVRCTHIIEHLDDPVTLIREMTRVSRHHITIVTPFKYGYYAGMTVLSKPRREGAHKQTFDAAWFEHVFQKLGLIRVRVSYSAYRFIPSRFMPWFSLPEEITAKAQVMRAEKLSKLNPLLRQTS
jgi:ubiquinone/menaquinone biosynthesis C-methylase UbiE